jgi:hypothetical protein
MADIFKGNDAFEKGRQNCDIYLTPISPAPNVDFYAVRKPANTSAAK